MSFEYAVLITSPTGGSGWHQHTYVTEEELRPTSKISFEDEDAYEVLSAWRTDDGVMIAVCVPFPKERFGPKPPFSPGHRV